MEAVLRALADESRRTVLETLAGGPATAGELAALLPIARPGVSRHLRVLREAGLVEARQEAQRRGHHFPPPPAPRTRGTPGPPPAPAGAPAGTASSDQTVSRVPLAGAVMATVGGVVSVVALPLSSNVARPP